MTFEEYAEGQLPRLLGLARTLLADVSQLPARQRAVIGLRYFLDLDDEQIADLLGCS